MTADLDAAAPRTRQRPGDKFDARRDELADAALLTLGELGYARTSLREIAQNSAFSHGVLHYYFADKTDLITYGVRRYKTQCATRYDQIVAESADHETLLSAFAAKLAQTLSEDSPMHRLWYDLRTQSLFDAALRPDVEAIDDTLEQMIWRVLTRIGELAGRDLLVDAGTAYGVLDGLFEQALLDLTVGRTEAPSVLTSRVERLLPGWLV